MGGKDGGMDKEAVFIHSSFSQWPTVGANVTTIPFVIAFLINSA